MPRRKGKKRKHPSPETVPASTASSSGSRDHNEVRSEELASEVKGNEPSSSLHTLLQGFRRINHLDIHLAYLEPNGQFTNVSFIQNLDNPYQEKNFHYRAQLLRDCILYLRSLAVPHGLSAFELVDMIPIANEAESLTIVHAFNTQCNTMLQAVDCDEMEAQAILYEAINFELPVRSIIGILPSTIPDDLSDTLFTEEKSSEDFEGSSQMLPSEAETQYLSPFSLGDANMGSHLSQSLDELNESEYNLFSLNSTFKLPVPENELLECDTSLPLSPPRLLKQHSSLKSEGLSASVDSYLEFGPGLFSPKRGSSITAILVFPSMNVPPTPKEGGSGFNSGM